MYAKILFIVLTLLLSSVTSADVTIHCGKTTVRLGIVPGTQSSYFVNVGNKSTLLKPGIQASGLGCQKINGVKKAFFSTWYKSQTERFMIVNLPSGTLTEISWEKGDKLGISSLSEGD